MTSLSLCFQHAYQLFETLNELAQTTMLRKLKLINFKKFYCFHRQELMNKQIEDKVCGNGPDLNYSVVSINSAHCFQTTITLSLQRSQGEPY